MLGIVARAVDQFRGSGDAAVTIPPMDGSLRPNVRIENGVQLLSIASPDNMVSHPKGVIFSSGSRLLQLGRSIEAPREDAVFSSEITCLAAHASGALAIGLATDGIVIRGGPHDGTSIPALDGRPLVCATAATFLDGDTLLICVGSDQFTAADWKWDLMTKRAGGSVWRVDLARGVNAECVMRGLAFPYGVAVTAEGRIIVSESWKHRIVAIGQSTRPETLYGDIPGYPARIVPDDEGNEFWLAVFAPRLQLVEFVLREDEYRHHMMTEIDPEYWIAPSLHSPRSFLEPLQGGGLKQLGELKPWAPSRSYGLVVRLDAGAQPIESFHSRANGTRHGVTACLPVGDEVIIASKGGDAIVAVER